MRDLITIETDNRQVLDAMARLARGVENPAPVLKAIGELSAESTMQRFAASTAPDGSRWAPNAEVTLERYLGRTSGNHKKDGSLTKKGAARLGAKKPLIGESRTLSTQIHWQLAGDDAVKVGSNTIYAAMQQFGGTKAQFPNLWGDIPARPFLGVSDEDARGIEGIVGDYLDSLIG